MKRARSLENILLAKELSAQGLANREIGLRFGVGETSIRNWLNDEAYRRHIDRALRWQKDNHALVNAQQRDRNKRSTREQKDLRNAYQRRRYQTDPMVKERFRVIAARTIRTSQGSLAQAVRVAALAFSDRIPPTHTRFMESMTGMSRLEFTQRFNAEGVFDHIVPIVAFDLTNPEHLIRCCHPSNLRIISRKENEMKGSQVPEGLAVMSLPWIGTDDALVQAQTFISRRLLRLERLLQEEGTEIQENQTSNELPSQNRWG